MVATHNRARLLPRLVEALAKQTDPGLVDVVVVDDASDDDTWDVLSALAVTAPFKLTTRRMTQNRGPAAARNVGWRATDAEVIAFTDDDCVPQPGWLTALMRAFAGADFVQGRVVANPSQEHRRGPFSHIVQFDKPDGFYETCNIAYRRALLEALGGFDEQFSAEGGGLAGPAYGEDTDLAWRALETGAVAAFDPDAVVFHDIWPSSYRARLAKARRADTIPTLLKRHPRIRDELYARWFYISYHPPALLAALGTALTLRRRSPWWLRLIGALCWLPYADNRMHRMPLWTRRRVQVVLLPAALAADLTEVAVVVRAAVRERTVLL